MASCKPLANTFSGQNKMARKSKTSGGTHAQAFRDLDSYTGNVSKFHDSELGGVRTLFPIRSNPKASKRISDLYRSQMYNDLNAYISHGEGLAALKWLVRTRPGATRVHLHNGVRVGVSAHVRGRDRAT